MALNRAQPVLSLDIWQALSARVGADGSAAHAHARHLSSGDAAPRDLADAAHLICSLHGRHPGVLDHAAQHRGIDAAQPWLLASVAAFAEERSRIVQMAVAVGPLPSTPGQAESEATVTAQRHALDMLALSDRTGCSLGASLALVLDWNAIGRVLGAVGKRFGVELVTAEFSSTDATRALADSLSGQAVIERAVLFGAQQLLAQHQGLFDLLQARAEARDRTL